MIGALRCVLIDEEGGALVEFALVLGLVSIATMGALTAFAALLVNVYKLQSTGYDSIGEYAK